MTFLGAIYAECSAVVLEDMVLVSRRLEDLKKSLGLEQKVLGLGLDGMVLVFWLKSCNFQDLQVKLVSIMEFLNCAQFFSVAF